MKITRVRPWIVTGPQEHVDGQVADRSEHMAKYVFVQVETDEGLTGWGEITTYPGTIANRTIAAALRELDGLLRGDDPTQVEALWHKVFRAYTYLGTRGAVTAMISAVDIACWDIKAQALGVPIHELLGGKVRENVPLYTHFQYDQTVERMVENAVAEVGRGSVGDQDRPVHGGRRPADADPSHGVHQRRDRARAREPGVAMIEGIRKAVGPDIQVLIDAHAMYNVPTAVRLATRLAPYDITWFEEPVPPESYEALADRPQPGARPDLRRRAALHPLRVPADPEPPPDRLHHAGRDLDRRHLGVEEDRDAGRDVLHRRSRPTTPAARST